ncbi:MAG: CDP-diacylglycerol--serine O-phosphatidyltransferase [Myxococcales bacterium]|nr:CDP-diacylglycerol--serine O-phosphatidyltransferase [Myxococcales bacterium]
MFREFSVADLMTLGNAACGTTAIFLCLQYLAEDQRGWLWVAFALLPSAFILDALDGWVARKLRRGSRLGADLDSLADIVSFGIAPVVLAYTLGARGGWDVAALVIFVCCGISRLARFNVTADELADQVSGKVKYFEGTPIPTSLLLVGVLAAAFYQDAVHADLWGGRLQLGPFRWHPITGLYLLNGLTMISATLRIPKP